MTRFIGAVILLLLTIASALASFPLIFQTSPAAVGAYADGCTGLTAYAAWLGRAKASIYNLKYLTPHDFTNATQISAQMCATGQNFILALAIGTENKNGTLDTYGNMSSGGDDAYYQDVAAALATYAPNAIVRLGGEMNRSTFDWGSGGAYGLTDAQYIEVYQRFVNVMRAVPGTSSLQFAWMPRVCSGCADPEPRYPGDAYVDIIGLVIFETTTGDGTDTGFNNNWVNCSRCLSWQLSYAQAHGKNMGLEWGVGYPSSTLSDADGPGVIQHVAAWINNTNKVNGYEPYLYFSYYNTNEGYCAIIDGTATCPGAGAPASHGPPYQLPNSSAAFLAIWEASVPILTNGTAIVTLPISSTPGLVNTVTVSNNPTSCTITAVSGDGASTSDFSVAVGGAGCQISTTSSAANDIKTTGTITVTLTATNDEGTSIAPGTDTITVNNFQAAVVGAYDGGCNRQALWAAWLGLPTWYPYHLAYLTPHDSTIASQISAAVCATGGRLELSLAIGTENKNGTLDTYANMIGGGDDQYYIDTATALATYAPNAVVRLGWEMNGTWSPGFDWASVGAYNFTATQYKAVFQHFVTVMRGVAGTSGLKFDWCPDLCSGCTDAESLYPGDAYVDIIGLDGYETDYGGGTDSGFATYWINKNNPDGQNSLGWQVAFAKAHGKDMSLGEWGVGYPHKVVNETDSPGVIQHMYRWVNNIGNYNGYKPYLYFDYWNYNDDSYCGAISGHSTCPGGGAPPANGPPYDLPNSAAAFLTEFSH